jgi:hypothetical protein
VLTVARLNLSTREARELGKFITELQDTFTKKGSEYGKTEFATVRFDFPLADSLWPRKLRDARF